MESEIYSYRAKVGQYDKHKDSPQQDQEPPPSKKEATDVETFNKPTAAGASTNASANASANASQKFVWDEGDDEEEERPGDRALIPWVEGGAAGGGGVRIGGGDEGGGGGGLQVASVTGRLRGTGTAGGLGGAMVGTGFTQTRDRLGLFDATSAPASTPAASTSTSAPTNQNTADFAPPRKKFADTLDYIYSQVSERQTLVYPRNWLLGVDLEPMKDVRKRLGKNKPTQLFMNQLFARESVSWYRRLTQHCFQRAWHCVDLMWLRLWSCNRRGITEACYRGMWGVCGCSGGSRGSRVYAGGEEGDTQCTDGADEGNGDDGESRGWVRGG